MPYFRKRGKKWYFTIEIGEGKNRKRKEMAGGRTKAEAEAAYARALVSLEVNGGTFLEPTKMTVDEFAGEFLADHAKNVHANTIKSYRSIYTHHIAPVIGSLKLRDIRARTLQNILNDKKEAGLSRSTVSSIHAVIKIMFTYASDFCEYIDKNPAQNLHIPKYTEPPKVVHSFTPDQVAEIFAAFPRGHQYFLPLAISYHTGARFGECCAITWQDVDFEAMEISINKTVIVEDKKLKIQDVPKSSHSFRIVPFGHKLLEILKREKRRQAVQKLAGSGPKDNLVVHGKNGKMMGPDGIRHFNEYCKKFGDGLSFHSMRHTHATMLLEAGEDLELVSKRLGHSSLNTTAKTYSHVLENRKAKSRELLDSVL